jgi:hypothetical protein
MGPVGQTSKNKSSFKKPVIAGREGSRRRSEFCESYFAPASTDKKFQSFISDIATAMVLFVKNPWVFSVRVVKRLPSIIDHHFSIIKNIKLMDLQMESKNSCLKESDSCPVDAESGYEKAPLSQTSIKSSFFERFVSTLKYGAPIFAALLPILVVFLDVWFIKYQIVVSKVELTPRETSILGSVTLNGVSSSKFSSVQVFTS